MQKQTASGASRQFKTPRKSLGDVTAADARDLLAAACDIADRRRRQRAHP